MFHNFIGEGGWTINDCLEKVLKELNLSESQKSHQK